MSIDVTKLAADLVVAYLGSEVVERVRHVESTVTPVVVVRAQCVVATALDVECSQVQRHVVSQREQSLRQLGTHHLAGPTQLRRQPHQTAHDRVDAALLDQPERREEGSVQRQVPGGDRLVRLVEAGEHRLDERVPEPERRTGELVGGPRVDLRVVAGVGTDQPAHGGVSKQLGQPVLVGDVLDDGADDLACLVVDGVAVPVRVDGQQLVGNAVVFAQPERMHRQQTELFVGPVITGLEARNARLTGVHLQT